MEPRNFYPCLSEFRFKFGSYMGLDNQDILAWSPGEDSHIKVTGVLVGALFPLMKVLESAVINLYHISTLKGAMKATTEDFLKLNTLRGTKPHF